MREHEIRLLRSLAKTLNAVREQLVSISEHQKAHQKPVAPPSPPAPVRNEVDFPPKIIDRYYREGNKNYQLQRRIFWVGLFTLVALTMYTCEVHRQTAMMRQQMVGTQAAIVGIWPSPGIETPAVTSSGPGSPALNIAFKNDGHVIATDVHIVINAKTVSLPAKTVTGTAGQCEFDLPVLGTEKPKDFQCPLNGLSDQIWQSMGRLEQTVAVDGTFSYGNGFGDRVRESICLLYVPQVRTKYGLDGDGNFTPCDRFPTTFDRLLKRRAEK